MLTRNSTLESRLVYLVCSFMSKNLFLAIVWFQIQYLTLAFFCQMYIEYILIQLDCSWSKSRANEKTSGVKGYKHRHARHARIIFL